MSAAALAALLRERQPCVVLTGAGVSTESGIPDFRSPTGLWAEVDPFEVASIHAFRRDPERLWSFYGPRIRALLAAEPNEGHRALAELERRGLVHAVVTQNIDTLHVRAGSREVVEVHGSIRSAECPRCHWTEGTDAVLAQLEKRPAPLCVHCGEVLKPGVTLFGELLPAGAMERATYLARSAGLVLAVGSSLEVWPAAGLPLEARAFAVVNRGPTALDDRALLVVDGGAGETLRAVLATVDQPMPASSGFRMWARSGMSSAMAETTTRKKTQDAAEKDFVTRLADAGEEALNKLAELPGGQRALNAANDLRTRMDELAKKVRGIDALEVRVTKLEKEIASLKKAKQSSRRSTTKSSDS